MEQPTYKTIHTDDANTRAITRLSSIKTTSLLDKYPLEKHLGNTQLSAMLVSCYLSPPPLYIHSIKQMCFLSNFPEFIQVVIHMLIFFTFMQHTCMFNSKIQKCHPSSTLRSRCCEDNRTLTPHHTPAKWQNAFMPPAVAMGKLRQKEGQLHHEDSSDSAGLGF